MIDLPELMTVALTFEAAGDPTPVTSILKTLQDQKVLATFFLDGRWAETYPDLVLRIAEQNHELGNHGYRHPDWTTMSDAEIVADLEATEAFIFELTGRPVKPWARPPFGAVDDRVEAVLFSAGYRIVYRHALDGGHWPGETTVEAINDRVRQSATDGAVLVFHTNRVETSLALPEILRNLKRGGFEIRPLGEIERTPPPFLERHPDFESLSVSPGYIRPKISARWQSINLLELGALARRETNRMEQIARVGNTALHLVTGDPDSAMDWKDCPADSYILLLAGELRCDFRNDSEEDLGYLVARQGDLFRCPAGCSYRLGPAGHPKRRWIAGIWDSLPD